MMAKRAADVLRSLVFYAAFYVGTVAYVLTALAMLPFSQSAFRTAVRGWSRYHRACARRLLGIRIELRGALPPGPALIALKHESFFEAIDLPALIGDPVVFAKAELLRIPLWGQCARAWGMIGVERGEGAKALRTMVAEAHRFSVMGRPFAIFPEGTRVSHGTEPPLQAGFAGLYKLLGLPVVPVAIDSGPLYHRRWKRPGTIVVAIGEPIPPGLPRAEIEARVLRAINLRNGAEPA